MKRICTIEEAARWINTVGCALLFPDPKSGLPSLWEALGREPINTLTWDDDVALLWDWKDQLPRKRLAWYGKFFRGKGTLIAPKILPSLSAAIGTPWTVESSEILYSRGLLSAEARRIAAALVAEGALPTLALRHACGFSDKRGNVRFKKAMQELQAKLLVTHFGAKKEEGAAWPSAVFELTPRAFLKLSKKAIPLPASLERMIR